MDHPRFTLQPPRMVSQVWSETGRPQMIFLAHVRKIEIAERILPVEADEQPAVACSGMSRGIFQLFILLTALQKVACLTRSREAAKLNLFF
jgi:hypothetical protein